MNRKLLYFLAPLAIFLVLVLVVNVFQSAKARDIFMVNSSLPVDPMTTGKVQAILSREDQDILNYAITDVSGSVVSVVGLPEISGPWNLENALWIGTVDLETGEVSNRAEIPPADHGGSGNILPFRSGSSAMYGTLGVHDCGYSLSGWRAVDLFPSDNQIYATQGGDISYVCRDSTQVSIRVGDFMYAHLVDTGQAVGDSYDQGQLLGSLVTGNFNDTCGYAVQQPSRGHVHFCFQPNPAGIWIADGYGLNVYNSQWVKGSSIVEPGGSLTATWEDATAVPQGTSSGMFNIFDKLLSGVQSIAWWSLTTFFLPPGTTQATAFYQLNWLEFFGNGTLTVIELTGAALSTFNWVIPGVCLFIDFSLFMIQLLISIYQFILGLIKKIPFL